MKILAIGGTYFLGKAFVELVHNECELTVLNRGNRALSGEKYKNVEQIICDRHDKNKLSELKDKDFDVVVDFCAYNEGDIETVIRALDYNIRQYIFISTCDVYKRGLGNIQDEDSPFEERNFGGEAGAYITGKVALEREVKKCADYGIHYTSIRPAFIYGPGNYAPRESMFFNWIANVGQIIYPKDSDGHFQMVYVEDVANLIFDCCMDEAAFDSAFKICGGAILTYDCFAKALEKAVDIPFERIEVSNDMIQEKAIPLPFPISLYESVTFSDTKIKSRGIRYTSLEDGLRKAFEYYRENEL